MADNKTRLIEESSARRKSKLVSCLNSADRAEDESRFECELLVSRRQEADASRKPQGSHYSAFRMLSHKC